MHPTSPMKPADDRKSELATAIEAANARRPARVYRAGGVFGMAGKPSPHERRSATHQGKKETLWLRS